MKTRRLGNCSHFAMANCTLAPAINVLGTYFPDWLFRVVAGASL